MNTKRVECGGQDIVVNTYEAIDACGNITTFEQSVYPDDFELTFEVVDLRLATLYEGGPKQINESEFVKYVFLYSMDESSVLAITPCDDVLLGAFVSSVSFNEDCEDGVNRVLTFTWTFMAGCTEDYTYEIIIEVLSDDVEEIILEPIDDVYCDDVKPALVILNQHEEFEYTVEEIDNRDTNGDGQVIRTVTMIDNCGNESKAEQVINFYFTTDLACEINGSPFPLCNAENEYFVVVSGGTAPYTIEWMVNGEDCSIAWAEGETAIINIGFGQATVIVHVTDANGCETLCELETSCLGKMVANNEISDALESNQVESIAADVVENVEDEKFVAFLDVVTITGFKFYPNPVVETVHLELPKLDEVQKINIIDVNGRVVLTKNIGSGTVRFSIDLTTLNTGVYFLKHINSHGKSSKKVFKL